MSKSSPWTNNYGVRHHHDEWSFLNLRIHLHKVDHYYLVLQVWVHKSMHYLVEGPSSTEFWKELWFLSVPCYLPLKFDLNFMCWVRSWFILILRTGLYKVSEIICISLIFICCARSPTCCWTWEDITGSEHRVRRFSSADVHNQSGAVTGNWGNLLIKRVTL